MVKRSIIVIGFVFLFFGVRGQKAMSTDTYKKNEIKFNALYLVIPEAIIEFSYERILNEESSVGARVGVGTAETDYRFEFMPYYRLYFSKNPASGFFAELNANTFVTNDYTYNYTSQTRRYENKLNFGMGIAVGGKFLTRNQKNVFEVHGGIGRNTSKNSSYEVYPVFGVTFGRRF